MFSLGSDCPRAAPASLYRRCAVGSAWRRLLERARRIRGLRAFNLPLSTNREANINDRETLEQDQAGPSHSLDHVTGSARCVVALLAAKVALGFFAVDEAHVATRRSCQSFCFDYALTDNYRRYFPNAVL